MVAFANIYVGNVTDEDVDTIGCRQGFLMDATFNASTDCRYAGATGGGRCGDVLEAVCTIATTVCAGAAEAAYPDVTTCEAGLAGIAHQWGSAQGGNSGAQNSLECRVYHAIASRTLGSSHCAHFTATVNSSLPCIGPVPSDATHYCTNLQYQCGEFTDSKNVLHHNTQFATLAQCMATAAGMPMDGDSQATNANNSLGCREYHSQASRADPNTHCQHAGPSGGGVCGTQRAAWAHMLAAAPCNDSHVNSFFGLVNSSVVDALVPPGFSSTVPYSTTYDTSMNTQACRIYHLGVASTDTSHCAHGRVSGGNSCGSLASNLCAFIGTACGFGTAKWQYPDNATCNTAVTGLTVGATSPVWDPSMNTFECRFYHASVAASYAAGGANAMDASMMTNHQLHCSHVLNPAAPGGCGYVAPNTTTANSATTMSIGASVIIVSALLF